MSQMNRFFVWGGIMLLASAFPAVAVEKKYIDKKMRSESVEYSIGLAAQRGDLGHAFVIWNKGDDAARLTIQQAVGFYPTVDTKSMRRYLDRSLVKYSTMRVRSQIMSYMSR
ncbi:hypothetical protein [Bosea sp. FBZP-16]|uniref:hypothetical protein n=1 Tax=Bosea sp. FBZP-16 TaxID=2065382 RepID=UPI00131A2E4F|nr:hypothetical protein [Bosea sp. FBZP-16]